MSDIVLSLITTSAEHPRFMITDPESNFWTGENWTDEESEARLYASVNAAGRAIQEILLAEYGDKPVRRFIAPVQVDLYAEDDLTSDEIADWLVKVARLTVDAETHGNGPADGTLGLLHIDWAKLREINN